MNQVISLLVLGLILYLVNWILSMTALPGKIQVVIVSIIALIGLIDILTHGPRLHFVEL